MFMHLTTTQEIRIVNILITEKFPLFYIRKHFVLVISYHWVVWKVTGPQTTYFFSFLNTRYWYFSMIVKNCQVITVCHISYYKYISELLRVKSSSQARQTSAHQISTPVCWLSSGKREGRSNVWSLWTFCRSCRSGVLQEQGDQGSSDIPPAQSCS